MSHPFLRLLVTEPGLLAQHAEAYADLISRDAGEWRSALVYRVVRRAVMCICLLLAIAFAGVALMLWAVTGVVHWVLFAVPALPAGVALVVWAFAREKERSGFLSTLRTQLAADAQMLREIP